MTSATRALIVFNPAAGRHPRRRAADVHELVRELRAGGWEAEMAETEAAQGAAPAVARGLEKGCSVLVACGGDGTLNQIAETLAARGALSAPALAVAPPFGTANVYANALGCPRRPQAAARWLLAARLRLRPLGLASSPSGVRHFLSIASVGYDAAIARDLSAQAKQRWGKLAYAARAAVAWRQYFPAPLEYAVAGRTGRADGVLFGLTPLYGGRLKLGRPGADGAIALALSGAPRLLPLQAGYLLTRGLEGAPGVTRLPSGPVGIATPGLPLELDGEPAGATPVTLALAPYPIRVLE
ncbi:MAG: diacylglycerol/lipid kinase family protein [Terriglobales bacterium]